MTAMMLPSNSQARIGPRHDWACSLEHGSVVSVGPRRPAPAGIISPLLPFGKEPVVPLYMDHHDLPGVKAEDVAKAHEADVRVQGQYGVDYQHYWVDEAGGQVWCLVEAPDKETATRVHREAHGLEAHKLDEVKQGA
jgi:hypothetical protein